MILLIWKKAVTEERWVLFLGCAAAVYAVEYGIESIFGYMVKPELVNTNANDLIRTSTALCSGATNILIFAAARDLLGYKKPFPWWSVLLTALGTIPLFYYDETFWSRVPDAALSTFCAGSLGYACSRNIGFRLHHRLSWAAVVVAVVYGIIQTAYSLNPYFSQGRFLPINSYLADPGAVNMLESLDTIVLVLALPFKLGLFFMALYIAIQSMTVVSANQARSILKGLLDGKQEYLSGDGVIKSIGEITKASKVSMHLLLPGRKIEQIAQFDWGHQMPLTPKPFIYRLSSAKGQVAESVIKGGGEVFYTKRIERFSQLNLQLEDVDPKTSIVAVPVRFHGATIGCLIIKWEEGMAFTRIAVKQIRSLVDLIAPIAQSYREIAALDQLSFRFTGWHAGKRAIQNINPTLIEIADILHDIISPLSTVITMNFGFQIVGAMHQANGRSSSFSQAIISDQFAKEAGINNAIKKDIEIIPGRLLVKIPYDSDDKFKEISIGELVFVVPKERDDLTQPTMARQYLHRRAIRAIVTDKLLEISRQHLNGVLRDFGVRLNSHKVKNVSEWFYELWRAATEAGLLWAVASQMNDGDLLGSPTWKQVVKENDEESIEDSQYKFEDEPYIKLISLASSEGETYHILKLKLRQTQTWVWLGVGRKGFGPELEFPSPWKLFLERFAEIADTSLFREFQQLQIETAQAQGLATVAVTTGTLHHQLTNLVKDITNPIIALNDAVSIGEVKVEGHWGQLVSSMKDSADDLLNLTAAVMDVTKIDNHRPCNLLAAARNAERLFAIALDQGKISLGIFISPDLEVDVPFHVASLALANLVSNSKDALFFMKAAPVFPVTDEESYHKNGTPRLSLRMNGVAGSVSRFIRIEADDAGDMVRCRITDNGPGILPNIRDHIFNLGVTTKPDSGGWGLFLVKRSLQENRGYIDLTHTDPEGTQFTIRFPKPRQEA